MYLAPLWRPRLPTRTTMLPRLMHYVTALTLLSAVSVVYQNTLAPWLQPPHVDQVVMAPDRALRTDHSLSDLFAEGAWQRGSCKHLQTSSGMLLFQEWEQTAQDEWKLWPITVVIGRGMSGATNQTPVIIEAEQGAEIKFTESLDMMSGGAPPIQRGRMIGNVHIYRSGNDDQAHALDIQTANVGIDKRKIWTTEPIRMNVGQARLVGRDLTIHLSGQANAAGGGSSAILDRMELIYLDQLVMPLANGGLWKQKISATEDAATPIPATISIQCGGRVEYDFAFDQLSLRESVSLVHQVPGAVADRFDCDSLELNLNDPTNDSIDRQGPFDWLADMVAEGSPATMMLSSFDAELAADRIELSATDGIIRAGGRLGVLVRRGGITARLASLIYQFDPQQPKAIGVIDASGAGIVSINDPSIPIRRAQWRDRFQLEPAGFTTTDDISSNFNVRIEGELQAWLTDGGEFQADKIEGVLKPDPQADPDSAASLVPDWFTFKKNVRIDTAAIKAETEYLALEFVAEENPLDHSTGSAKSSPNASLRQWVVQPAEHDGLVDPVARPRPVIRGDSVRARLRRNKSGLSAKDLTVTGSVEVVHTLETDGQSLPARLTGERLRLIDGGGKDILQLESGIESPARLEIGDGFFVGPMIQVRPSDNIVWINAAGEFQMPTAALPTGLAGDTDSNIRWSKAPHCRWQGEMTFDGRTAVLSDGVDITASLVNGREPWDLHMAGDRLEVDLLESIQFSDMQTMRGATVQRISLMQATNRPARVKALQRGPDGVLEAKYLIHASKLSLTPAGGGKIIGEGPGWFRGWMTPQADSALIPSSNATLIDGGDRELTGIHLIFNDSMQADMTDRKLDFLRGVRVGVRAVGSWEEAVDATTMGAISMGESTLDCDRLRFIIAPGFDPSRRIAGAPTPWEMEASTGVVFRTRNERGLLEGTASRASYASAKDLFTVEGASNRAAILRQTLPDGSPGTEGAFRSILIRPKSMTIENAVFERLNFATPTSNANR